MGEMEKKVRKEVRKTKINKAVIDVIATAGLLSLALVAPNVIGALGKMKFVKQRKFQVKSSFSKLLDGGYVELVKKDGKKFAQLTKKGQLFAARMEAGKALPKKPKKWDGKWRVLIFDIGEKYKNSRNKIRTSLITTGFVRLQDSVWVYPYDCEDFITILKLDLQVGKQVVYMIVDKIENDTELRKTFNLPLGR
ncbi:hypothetical protein EPO56_02465 [Patescibacteria group bacterium]|nr:MAG: hypothetical protein EPO56_02465 [Patescibacteria group bacterium]